MPAAFSAPTVGWRGQAPGHHAGGCVKVTRSQIVRCQPLRSDNAAHHNQQQQPKGTAPRQHDKQQQQEKQAQQAGQPDNSSNWDTGSLLRLLQDRRQAAGEELCAHGVCVCGRVAAPLVRCMSRMPVLPPPQKKRAARHLPLLLCCLHCHMRAGRGRQQQHRRRLTRPLPPAAPASSSPSSSSPIQHSPRARCSSSAPAQATPGFSRCARCS